MINAPISIIITTYNDSEYLSGAIESILNQDMLPHEIIVVDDGSESDHASDVVKQYICNENEISFSFFKKSNGGASSARNYGLKYATQPYITFLDADDEMTPSSLSSRYNVLKDLPENYFGVYGSALTTKGPSQEFINYEGFPCTSLVGRFHTGIPGGSSYYLMRKSYLQKINGFDESLTNNEDFDFIIRLIKSGGLCKGSVGYVNIINIREGSLSRQSNYEKIFNSLVDFLNKAELNSYFAQDELEKRRRDAHLFLAKRVLINDKRPIKAAGIIKKAFRFSPPDSFKYRVIYMFCFFF